MGKKIFNT